MSVHTISLSRTWSFASKGSAGSSGSISLGSKERDANVEWRSGTVPGSVQTDLIALGELKDPFYGLQEADCRHLEEQEWIYRKTFHLRKQDQQPYDTAKLVFEGIDTVAQVYLNGCSLGRTDNMFIAHAFETDGCLLDGDNVLEVHFESSMKVMREREQLSSMK